MRAKDPARCTNCRRLQARVDALEAELAALKEVVAQLRPATRRGPQGLLDLLQAPLLRHRQAAQAATAGGPGPAPHRRTARPPQARARRLPARDRSTAGPSIIASTPAPACGHDLQPMPTDRAARRPAGRHPRGAAVDPGAPQSSGVVPALSEDVRGPAPAGDRSAAAWSGRRLTTADRLPQGGLPRLLLDRPQVPPRRRRVTISRGQLAKIIAKVSRALERPYEELLDDLPGQARLNVDETGHKQNGQRQWTWCFRAGLYTLFKIDPTRSARRVDRGAGRRSSTGCWGATTSRPTGATIASSACRSSSVWRT